MPGCHIALSIYCLHGGDFDQEIGSISFVLAGGGGDLHGKVGNNWTKTEDQLNLQKIISAFIPSKGAMILKNPNP